MSQLIGVHGIGNEYRWRKKIVDEWTSALTGGLEWATGHSSVKPPDLDVAFYGHLFRSGGEEPSAMEGTVKGPADDQGVAELAGLEAEELSELTEAVQEIISPDDLASASAGTDKAVMWLPAPVQRLAGAILPRRPRHLRSADRGDRLCARLVRDRRYDSVLGDVHCRGDTGRER